MHITIQDTPNPQVKKFFLGIKVLQQDTIYYFERKKNFHKTRSTFPDTIFYKINDIISIMLTSNFISLTKKENSSWQLSRISSIIVDYFVSGNPLIELPDINTSAAVISKVDISSKVDVSTKIDSLIQNKIKPFVLNDGGNIVFHKYEDGMVFIRLYGACSGCPSSVITLRYTVETMLKEYIPEVKSVISLN